MVKGRLPFGIRTASGRQVAGEVKAMRERQRARAEERVRKSTESNLELVKKAAETALLEINAQPSPPPEPKPSELSRHPSREPLVPGQSYTVTTYQLQQELVSRTGVRMQDVAAILGHIADIIRSELAEYGNKVEIKNLGTFEIVETKDKENQYIPFTGKRMTVKGKRKLKFRASDTFFEGKRT